MNIDLQNRDSAQAMQAYLEGDWQNAQQRFNELVEREPDNAYLHLLLGNIAYARGELQHAVAHYERATAVKPDFGVAWYKLGVCRYRAGELEKGLESFQKVVELGGQSHAMASYFVGLINFLLGRDREAISGFAGLKSHSDQSLIANYYLAQLRIREGAYEEALELLEELAARSPTSSEIHYLTGLANERLHRNFEAVTYYRKVVELDPADRRARAALELLVDVQEP